MIANHPSTCRHAVHIGVLHVVDKWIVCLSVFRSGTIKQRFRTAHPPLPLRRMLARVLLACIRRLWFLGQSLYAGLEYCCKQVLACVWGSRVNNLRLPVALRC